MLIVRDRPHVELLEVILCFFFFCSILRSASAWCRTSVKNDHDDMSAEAGDSVQVAGMLVSVFSILSLWSACRAEKLGERGSDRKEKTGMLS